MEPETPCVASEAIVLREDGLKIGIQCERIYLPISENPDGHTLRDEVPPAHASFGRRGNEGFDPVLRVQELDVQQLAHILRISLDLQLHSLKRWGNQYCMTNHLNINYLPFPDSTRSSGSWRALGGD